MWSERFQVDILVNLDQFSKVLSRYGQIHRVDKINTLIISNCLVKCTLNTDITKLITNSFYKINY